MPLNNLTRAAVSDQMESNTILQDNVSVSSPVLSLCPSAATYFFLPFIYALLFITAPPGNVLSLWLFLRRISTASPTHIYLSHLSISNLMLSLTAPFLTAYYAQGSVWTLNSVLCQLVLHAITPVLHINIYISLTILTLLALSRFAALIQHTHASRPSVCKMLLPHGFFTCLTRTSFASRMCAVMWVFVVGAVVPVTVYYSVKEVVSGNAAATSEGRDTEGRQPVEVCYNPAVEVGGSLSAACSVFAVVLFFVFYLLVLLSYMLVLKHIRRSRRSTSIATSQNLLGRVLRNLVVIQVVLSVCLLPYHIFRPIFNSWARDQHQPTSSTGTSTCHPMSSFVELKNCLILLAAFRGSTDPLMYFLLDKTFRHQTLRLLRSKSDSGGRQMGLTVTGSVNQKVGELGEGNAATAIIVLSNRPSSVF